MVAQLVPNPQQTNSSQPSAAQGELQKLREYCRRLNQALEVERAKASKLRQYIARFNSTRSVPEATPSAPQNTDAALQSLIEDQTRLLEQLYSENQQQHSENQKQRSLLNDLENKIQQLLVANDKLKARNIELRRKLKPTYESEIQETHSVPAVQPITLVKSAPTTKLAAVKIPAESAIQQTITPTANKELSEKQRRWFRFPITKK